MRTSVALLGPALVAPIVNVIVSPTFGVALSTVLSTTMSADAVTGTTTVPTQCAAAGQVGSPPPLVVAVLFAAVAAAVTLTLSVSVVLAPAASVPVNVQVSAVVPTQFQFVPLALASVMPVASVSAMTIGAVVTPAPVFCTVMS